MKTATLVQFENENFRLVNVLVEGTGSVKKAIKAVKEYQSYLRCVIKETIVFHNPVVDYDNQNVSNGELSYYFIHTL